MTRLFHETDKKRRYISYYEIFTTINLTFFATAIITGLDMNEDDGTCMRHRTEASCLYEHSIYDSNLKKCAWKDANHTVSILKLKVSILCRI